MRSRGEGAAEVFTAETMAEKFGVVQGSYDAVQLPRLDAHTVRSIIAPTYCLPKNILPRMGWPLARVWVLSEGFEGCQEHAAI